MGNQPNGSLFEIRGVTGLAVSLPLGRTIEHGAWVSVIPQGGDEAVYGLTCANLSEARKHASGIASQIEDGTLQVDA